jgi:hypothetical protein
MLRFLGSLQDAPFDGSTDYNKNDFCVSFMAQVSASAYPLVLLKSVLLLPD